LAFSPPPPPPMKMKLNECKECHAMVQSPCEALSPSSDHHYPSTSEMDSPPLLRQIRSYREVLFDLTGLFLPPQ